MPKKTASKGLYTKKLPQTMEEAHEQILSLRSEAEQYFLRWHEATDAIDAFCGAESDRAINRAYERLMRCLDNAPGAPVKHTSPR